MMHRFCLLLTLILGYCFGPLEGGARGLAPLATDWDCTTSLLPMAATTLDEAAPGNGLDSVPREALVFVETFDAKGNSRNVSVGVIIKKGVVAVNYHYIAGAAKVVCFAPGSPDQFPSNGYFSVEESQDIIVLSVPNLMGKFVTMSATPFPGNGTIVQLTANADQRRLVFGNGVVNGSKEIKGMTLTQVISTQVEDCTGGPIFQSGKLIGFSVAGYLDNNRYYAYTIPVAELKRLLNLSFIIKSFSSVNETKPDGPGFFQGNLMESLTSVLWQSIPDAEQLARTKRKMMLIDVNTRWAGWSKLMEKNTYTQKSIIRYLNENFYAVKLDAETHDTILFNRLSYFRNNGSPYHTLAYSLLEGRMDFPSTVILDEDVNVLMVIPGYMDARKMEVVLHYFKEKQYLEQKLSFQQYELRFWQQQEALGGQ